MYLNITQVYYIYVYLINNIYFWIIILTYDETRGIVLIKSQKYCVIT